MDELYKIPMLYGAATETDSRELFQHMKELCLETTSRERSREMMYWFDTWFPGVRRAVIEALKESDLRIGDRGVRLEHINGKVRASNHGPMWTNWYTVDDTPVPPRIEAGSKVIIDMNWLGEGSVGQCVSPLFEVDGTMWVSVLLDDCSRPTCHKARGLVPWHEDFWWQTAELKEEGAYPDDDDIPYE